MRQPRLRLSDLQRPQPVKRPDEPFDLMQAPSLGGIKLGPEDRLAIAVSDYLRIMTRTGKLHAVWFHVENELPQVGTDPRRFGLFKKRRRKGVIAGVADHVFMWRGGGGAIELKPAGGDVYLGLSRERLVVKRRMPGRLSDAQQAFRRWCEDLGVPYCEASSVEQVADILRHWSVLK